MRGPQQSQYNFILLNTQNSLQEYGVLRCSTKVKVKVNLQQSKQSPVPHHGRDGRVKRQFGRFFMGGQRMIGGNRCYRGFAADIEGVPALPQDAKVSLGGDMRGYRLITSIHKYI